MGPVHPAGMVIFLASILIVATLGGYLIFIDTDEAAIPQGYLLENSILDESLDHNPGRLDIDVGHTKAQYHFGKEGMYCSLRKPGDTISISRDMAADSISVDMSLDRLSLPSTGKLFIEVQFDLGSGTGLSVLIEVGRYRTDVNYEIHGKGSISCVEGDMMYDISDSLSLLVQLREETVILGINGINEVVAHPMIESSAARFKLFSLGVSEGNPCDGEVLVKHVSLGRGQAYRYQDGLHKTIVPDGKDFAFSLHVHADRAYPEQLQEMASLADEYGISGTYDAWVRGDSRFYGMDGGNFTTALHALQDSGWGLGVHAVAMGDLNRSEVIEGIHDFSEEFGPPTIWSDHGARPQDLFVNGSVPGSEHYIADQVEEIGAGWWHVNTRSHSSFNDLNREGMDYREPGLPSLPLFRVSKMQAWKMFADSGDVHNVSHYLRAWPMDRSVFVTHDYMPYFFYVKNDSGPLCILPEEEGIGFFPWSSLVPKTTFVGDDWAVLPSFVRFLNWTQIYDVWFAPVREIYDRSCLVQAVTMSEDENEVILTNPTDETIHGLTLFTKGRPLYSLKGPGAVLQAEKGTSESWHFVIDLGPGEVLVLKKVQTEAGLNGMNEVSKQFHIGAGYETMGMLLSKMGWSDVQKVYYWARPWRIDPHE